MKMKKYLTYHSNSTEILPYSIPEVGEILPSLDASGLTFSVNVFPAFVLLFPVDTAGECSKKYVLPFFN